MRKAQLEAFDDRDPQLPWNAPALTSWERVEKTA